MSRREHDVGAIPVTSAKVFIRSTVGNLSSTLLCVALEWDAHFLPADNHAPTAVSQSAVSLSRGAEDDSDIDLLTAPYKGGSQLQHKYSPSASRHRPLLRHFPAPVDGRVLCMDTEVTVFLPTMSVWSVVHLLIISYCRCVAKRILPRQRRMRLRRLLLGPRTCGLCSGLRILPIDGTPPPHSAT